jgi:hypothetical protein
MAADGGDDPDLQIAIEVIQIRGNSTDLLFKELFRSPWIRYLEMHNENGISMPVCRTSSLSGAFCDDT